MRFILTTFIIIFLAELGDKTQLTTMMMATKCKSIWPVFIASSLALTLSSFLGAYAGSIITKFVPENYIQIAAGCGFILIGILLLTGKI